MSETDLPRDRVLRRYHAHLLRSIVIRSNSTANTITFEKLSGEADEYAIALREGTDESRSERIPRSVLRGSERLG